MGDITYIRAQSFDEAWNNSPVGKISFAYIVSSDGAPSYQTRWFCQQWKDAVETHGWQVIWSFNDRIYKRYREGSDRWTSWIEFATKSDLNKEIKTVIVSPNSTYRLYVIHSGFALWFHGSANTQYHIYGITGQTAFPIMEGTDTGGITFSRVNQNAYNVTTETSYELYMMLLGDFTFEKIG